MGRQWALIESNPLSVRYYTSTARNGLEYAQEFNFRIGVTKKLLVVSYAIFFGPGTAITRETGYQYFGTTDIISPNVGEHIDVLIFENSFGDKPSKCPGYNRASGKAKDVDHILRLIVGAEVYIEICNQNVDPV